MYLRSRATLSTLLATLALAPAGAGAQTTAEAVVSPSAYAPPVLYRSVFVDTPSGLETEETDWKKANAEVGQFKRGHVDILRWEESQAAKISPLQAAPPANLAPSATEKIAPHAHSTGSKP